MIIFYEIKLHIFIDNLLKQAGVLSPPTTWLGGSGDVLNTVPKLTVKDNAGKIITAGMAIGTATNIDHFGEIFGALLLLNGGDLKKLNQQESIDALKLYRRFAEDGYWSDTMSNSIASFIQGRTAMIFGPTWHVINIKAQNPELKVKVAPVPKGVEDTEITLSNYWVEGVNKYSKNQLEAWKFLKYLSEKDSLTKIYEAQTKTRLFGSAPSRLDMYDTVVTNEYLSPMLKAAKAGHMKTLPVVDRTYDNGLNDEILQYLENAINQTVNGVDYPEALKTAQEGITSVFAKYEIQ
jgi:multiple sugar transport system substrate-binding protein